jgi:hypothetical protein
MAHTPRQMVVSVVAQVFREVAALLVVDCHHRQVLTQISIVAHIKRTERAEKLADKVLARRVFYDDGTLGCDRNHRQVWQHHAGNPTSDWATTLEDDAVPVPGFLDQLDHALEVAPAPIVSLYLGTSRPLGGWQPQIKQAILAIRRTPACWITSTHLLHAVGVAIRTPLLPSLLEWLPQIPLPIDEAITIWATTYGHCVAYTWPSLVDHADEPSLVDHPDGKPRQNPRIAWHTGTRQAWNAKHVAMKSPYARSH